MKSTVTRKLFRVSICTIVLLAVAKASQTGYTAVPGCIEYKASNLNECEKCMQRFYLKPPKDKSITDHATCQPCVDGCLVCNDGLKCVRCDLRYTQRPENSTCELCDSSCNTCGSDPSICTSCPKFSSLDKSEGKCTWTFRILIGGLAIVAGILLCIIISFSCKGKKEKKKPKRPTREITENILDEYSRNDNTRNDLTRAQLINSINMIGVGNNDTNLSEVDKETEAQYSNTEDFGGLVKNNLAADRRSKDR